MTAPVMKILYGPPGTGKTFRAAREAVRVIEPAVLDKDVEDRHRLLVAAGRIIWVTFHPSYAYEDFVEGYRPRRDEKGNLTYRVVNGPFKKACAATVPSRRHFQVGERIGRGQGVWEVVEVHPGGLVLKRANNRSDSGAAETYQFADYWTVDRARAAGLTPDVFSLAGGENDLRRAAAARAGMPVAVFGNGGRYAALWEALDQVPAAAPVVLVIDEINRADLSRVFGELMTLLEPDKRIGQREERLVTLPYSRKPFGVPSEVSVIGTMNTADRSLAVLDIALRRRFEFEEVAPDPDLCPSDYGGVDVGALLRAINLRVEALRSRDNRIGHSDLMPGALDRVRQEQGWPDDTNHRLRTLALVLRRRTLPLLLEYFAEDWRKADLVLGRQGLLEAVPYEHVAALADDYIDVDLEEHTGFTLPASWDPLDDVRWDEAGTRARLTAAARTT